MLIIVMLASVIPAFGTETTNGDFSLPIIPIEPIVPTIKRGDLDADNKVDVNDAIYCLRRILFPTGYVANQNVDFDGDGEEDVDDAIYLLRCVLFPQSYQLKGSV